jgi:PST family polysaccharide transporter
LKEGFGQLRASYLSSLKWLTMLTIPASAGLALIAADLVQIAYSSVWAPSIPVIWVLSINAAVQSIAFSAGDLFKATGRPRFLVRLSILNIAISTPMLLFGTRYGIVGVAIAQSIGNVVIVLVTIAVVLRPIEISVGEFLRALRPAVLGTVIMAAGCAAVLSMTHGLEPFARLPLTVASGLLLYAVAIRILDEDVWSAIWTS